MANHVIYWENVTEGSEIPPVVIELTMKRMMMAVCATRDFYPLHHDQEFARAAGHKDIVVNVQFLEGFLGRCLTDWTGPEGKIRKLSLATTMPNYLGDTITAKGKVSGKYVEKGNHNVDCELVMLKQDGMVTANSRATVILPAKS